MTHRHVDYANTCFHYPILMKIEGEPTYATLITLKEELTANASSVDSNLGGGDHGYLGLVSNYGNYAKNVGTTPFIPQFTLLHLQSQPLELQLKH